MTVGPTALFWEVVRSAAELPGPARSGAVAFGPPEVSAFDETYLAFLDEQIGLGPRGPAWTERLRVRRAGLAPYCGVPLVSGHVRAGTSGFTIYVDPRARRVVYWEEYRAEFGAGT
jgi:hypothetical protein